MPRSIIILLLISLSLLWGCETMIDDLDEDKLPKVQSKLVVQAYISPQMDVIRVLVSESQPIFGEVKNEINIITNATVTLSNDQSSVQIPLDSVDYRLGTDKFKIEAGKKYTLTVTDGSRTVKASCVVPAENVQVKNFTLDTVYAYRFDADTTLRVRVSWIDTPGVANYYTVRGIVTGLANVVEFDQNAGEYVVHRRPFENELYFTNRDYLISDTNLDGRTLTSPDGYANSFYNYFTYADKDGKTHTVFAEPKLQEIRYEISSLDENYYKFQKSLKDHENSDNPFVEPLPVYSNVEGGLGCFGAYNSLILEIKP